MSLLQTSFSVGRITSTRISEQIMLKQLLPILSAGCMLTASAQVDINALLQQQGSNVRMVPDTDPYTPNSFVGSFNTEMHFFEGTTESKHSPTNMTIHSSAEKLLIEAAMPGTTEKMRFLIDQKGKWQYMLMDSGKGGRMALKSAKMKVVGDEKEAKNAADVLVTDETKTIDGHPCKKMIAKTEDGTWTGWLAQDIDVPFHSFMRDVQRTGADLHADALTGVHGFPLEYEFVSTDGKERVQCFIRDLKLGVPDAKVFALDGYQVVEMPTMGR